MMLAQGLTLHGTRFPQVYVLSQNALNFQYRSRILLHTMPRNNHYFGLCAGKMSVALGHEPIIRNHQGH